VVGKPVQMDNTPSEIEKNILLFIKKLSERCPNAKVVRYDERFTSIMAQRTLLEAGLKKQQRQNKALIDQTSAVILLQSYLEHKRNFLKI
ncbi:MAG TPA: Holliday junction resolvase RuvX, partial [Bacteroidia bacterium]|nr:Holliday junction resolvase RuvX [Bacteroidia bacterium]